MKQESSKCWSNSKRTSRSKAELDLMVVSTEDSKTGTGNPKQLVEMTNSNTINGLDEMNKAIFEQKV